MGSTHVWATERKTGSICTHTHTQSHTSFCIWTSDKQHHIVMSRKQGKKTSNLLLLKPTYKRKCIQMTYSKGFNISTALRLGHVILISQFHLPQAYVVHKDFANVPVRIRSQLPHNGSTALSPGPSVLLVGTESLCLQSNPKHPSPVVNKHVFPQCQQ